MTFQLKQGRKFDPAGWDLVRTEALIKAEKLAVTSRDQIATWNKDGNWSWFNKNGFQDPYDVETRNRVRFPQRPYDYPIRPAGLRDSEPIDRLTRTYSALGRAQFLDRGPPILKAKQMGHSQSTGELLMKRLA
ncbi:unnamed protein product [Amoebophrya sp. A25]|nr:unnamed protein product [Amoebophrya sp. A25]|eukprot:GSA25T00003194001.1